MKITVTQIILLVLLAVVGWGYAAYNWIITPAIASRDNADQRLAAVQRQQTEALRKISRLPELEKEEEVEEDRIAAAIIDYYSSDDYLEERIVQFVHTLAEETDLLITEMNFGGTSLRNLDQMILTAAAAEQAYAAGQLADEVRKAESEEEDEAETATPGTAGAGLNAAYAYSFTLTFKVSGYESFMMFLEGFEQFGKLTLIDNVSLNKLKDAERPGRFGPDEVVEGEEEAEAEIEIEIEAEIAGNEPEELAEDIPMLDGTMNINLMAIDSVVFIEAVLDDVEIEVEFGKENPFETVWEYWETEEEAEIED